MAPLLNLNTLFGTIQKPLTSSFPTTTLTLIMIVKNEVAHVKRAIESARTVVDEIVVNDTGSTDGTQNVLESLGVKWFQSKWENDFSKARNQCIDKASCSWILWMDADDQFPPETVDKINTLKREPLDRIIGFEVVNCEGEGKFGSRFLQIRMFPNHPKIRFERKIHEQIEPSAAKLGLHCLYHPLPIYHYGYQNPSLKIQKAKRNLSLILQDKKRLAEDPSFAFSLGDAYYILEDWEKGIEAYKKTFRISQCREINEEIFNECPSCIGLGYLKLKQWKEAVDWLEKAREAKPNKLEPAYYLAEVWEESGDKARAIQLYKHLIQMEKPHTGSLNRYDAIHMNSYLRLGKLLYLTKEHKESIRTFQFMRQKHPNLVEPCYWMGRNYRELGNFSLAISSWLDGLKLNPKAMPEMYRELLDLLEKNGTPEMVEECKKLGQQLEFTDEN